MNKTILTLSCAATVFGAGCIGPNNAFNAVNNWNAKLTQIRIINELIYLVGWIFPAYELIWLSDQLIWNSVEFWGADNPIGAPKPFAYPE